MVTLGGLSLEVERSRSKIAELGGSVALSAGDGIMAEEIIDRTRQLMVGNTAIDSVVLSLQAAYVAARDRLINERLLRPIGYQHVQQLLNDGQKQLGAQLFASAIQNLSQFDLGTEILLAGFGPRGASVAHVTNPGTMRWVNAVEFFAIGSGSMHAMLSLMLLGYSSTWPVERALLHVYLAKRAAEAAPGVGNSTDLWTATASGAKPIAAPLFAEIDRLDKVASGAQRSYDYGQIKELYDAASTVS